MAFDNPPDLSNKELAAIKKLADGISIDSSEPLQRLAAIACIFISKLIDAELDQRSRTGRHR